MIKPYYDHDGITLYHCRAEELLAEIDDATLDAIITDPPYGISGRQDEVAITVDGHAPFKRQFGEWDNEWSPRFLLEQANRLLRPGGALIAFMAHEWIPEYLQTPLDQKKLGVWVKTNPAPRVRPGYQHGTEFWCWQVKAGRAPTWNGGFTQNNAIVTPNARAMEGQLVHPTQKPIAIIKGFVDRHSNPGDMVCDPFLGSGTTARACKDLGRRFVGCDINEAYLEIAVKRLAQAVLAL